MEEKNGWCMVPSIKILGEIGLRTQPFLFVNSLFIKYSTLIKMRNGRNKFFRIPREEKMRKPKLQDSSNNLKTQFMLHNFDGDMDGSLFGNFWMS